MRVSILCSNAKHPVYPRLLQWKQSYESVHEVELVDSKEMLSGGDILFLISCHEFIGSEVRNKYSVTLVIHASDLPKGRGWSPHVWQILEGEKDITLSLLEAEDKIDSGAIWRKEIFHLEGHELADEINEKLFDIEIKMLDFALDNYGSVIPQLQDDQEATYYPKRTPDNSRIFPEKTIAEQFDLLRTADSKRFPAFMDYRGCRYYLRCEKAEPVSE
ncbi:MAG: formyltransferase family protein [Sedimenticola sp.]